MLLFFAKYRQRMEEQPEPVEINTASFTYRDIYGCYQMNPKKWVEELRYRKYMTPRGITKFVKYETPEKPAEG